MLVRADALFETTIGFHLVILYLVLIFFRSNVKLKKIEIDSVHIARGRISCPALPRDVDLYRSTSASPSCPKWETPRAHDHKYA